MSGTIENLLGPRDRLFAETRPNPDESSFQVDNTSARYFQSPYYTLHKDQLQPVPPPRVTPPRIDLAEVLGDAVVGPIVAAKAISFHAVGDTGAAKVNAFQTVSRALANEAGVADSMARDVQQGGAGAPAFFFHLGDVVYYFGEAQYYYDQFYEPFRAYDRPIFAIPGNHDGAVFGSSGDVPQIPTLTAFLRNFCAGAPGPSPDSGGMVRTAMTQPGVYFTLDAPFVSVIGLYSNVLEGPGVISSQGGRYPAVNDDQLAFLTAELTRLKPEREAGQRAVVVACHHPPVSVDAQHGGTTGLADDIDRASHAAGLWPDAVLSGHAHLYQRYTRGVDNREIPYVVAGSGGFAANAVRGQLETPLTVGQYTLVAPPIAQFGYLVLTVDLSAQPGRLTIAFHSPTRDSVTVNLATGRLLAGG
jgi:hypothetical protein